MKHNSVLLLVIVMAMVIFSITISSGGFGTINESETTTTTYVSVHLELTLLSGEKMMITSDFVEATKHHFTQSRGQYQIASGCYLTLPDDPASHHFQQDMTKIVINNKADQLVDEANQMLKNFGGGPFEFKFTPARVRGECNQSEFYASIFLSYHDNGERWGPGFLRANNESEGQHAYLYIPIQFYDDILLVVTGEKSLPSFNSYPAIEILGGYSVIGGDPNNTGKWLNDQLPFLRRVYLTENPQRVDFSGLVNQPEMIEGLIYK